MQLRALRYFNEVAQCASLRKAADRLYVTPTAVGRQIEQLEHYYGATLIERGPRGIRLTYEGAELARGIAIALKELDAVRENISMKRSVVSGLIRIYVSESLVSLIIGPVLAKFSQTYPQVEFDVQIGSSPICLDALKNGSADICLAFYMPESSDVEIIHQCELEHRLVVRSDQLYAKRDHITIHDLAGLPLAIPGSGFNTRKTIESAAKRENVRLNVVFSTSSLEVQRSLAREGVAMLILPHIGHRDCILDDQLISIPIIDPQIGRVRVDLCLPKQRNSSVATRLLQEMIVGTMGVHQPATGG